jgi:hypothetical protein
MLGGYPAAGIGYADRGHARVLVTDDLDGAVRRSVPDRVDHEVGQRAADLG